MSLRTIMIFPEFNNMDIIDEIRDKYDPLAKLVRPHITIVFPFEEFDSTFPQMEKGYKYTQELFYIYSRSNVLR